MSEAGISISPRIRQHYAAAYRGPSEWRRLGALDKAANVVALCGSVPHRSVLEIGAGDGALLARLAELRFAEELHALEISPSALEAIHAREIPSLVDCRLFDGYRLPQEDGRFDLAILSHVLEHVEYPRKLLYEAARVARTVFVEVPTEDTVRLPRDFAPDAVGHIDFYSPRSIRRLVQSCGLEVPAQTVSNPARASYVARCGTLGGWLRWGVKEAALRLAPAVATQLFSYHSALRCGLDPTRRSPHGNPHRDAQRPAGGT